MQLDYVDPTAFSAVEMRKAEYGMILFRDTYDAERAPRLVVGGLLEDGEDEEDRARYYLELSGEVTGFRLVDGNLNDVGLGVVGWRIEVDPASVKSTGAGRPRAGDVIVHRGVAVLRIWNSAGQPFDLDLATYTVKRNVSDTPTSVFFGRWRVVKNIEGHDHPVMIFERN